MIKTSTLVYSINNLASKTEEDFKLADDLDNTKEFEEVYDLLKELKVQDVDQSIVDNLLNYSKSL